MASLHASEIAETLPRASIIIPAHNESTTIGRLLRGIVDRDDATAFDIVVVCNGCADDTAAVARRHLPQGRVFEIETASKNAALALGHSVTDVFPRVLIDADIEIDRASIFSLIEPLGVKVLATAPQRVVDRQDASAVVSWYLDVWERLPQVSEGLFARGVIALSKFGFDRCAGLSSIMSDDLAISEAFGLDERRVVHTAVAVVRPARNLRSLLARRIRVATGNLQADDEGIRSAASRTTWRVLLRMCMDDPRIIPKVPIFIGIAILSRPSALWAFQRRDFGTWRRDESSRSGDTHR